jgi:hypothetical protein
VALTSPALIVLLVVLAGLLMVGALSFWHVLAQAGIMRVLARIMVVCALDVVVVALTLATANRSGSFYASWSELFGTEHASGRIIALGRGPVTARSVHSHDGQLTVTAKLPVAVPGQPPRGGGQLLAVSMTGPLSGITASGYLYVPGAAQRAAARHHGLQVIVIISNQLRVRAAGFFARRIADTAAVQIRSGLLRPVLIMMLPASIAPGAGRNCLDVPGGPQAGTFFAQDLPLLIKSEFPASSSSALWAVAGDSTGGYCALQLALTNSAVYSVAAAPAGYYAPQPAPGHLRASLPLREQQNLIYLLEHQPMQPVSVLLIGRPVAASPILGLARPPMRVSLVPSARGRSAPGLVLDEISRLLGTQP